ncbi:cyclin-dependent kinase 9 kinase, partial [Tubulinosema ratisbonensis]
MKKNKKFLSRELIDSYENKKGWLTGFRNIIDKSIFKIVGVESKDDNLEQSKVIIKEDNKIIKEKEEIKNLTQTYKNYARKESFNKINGNSEDKIEEIKKIFKQIVEGMVYLKNQNILHRDLKTANILVNEELEIKIADFGLAKYKINKYNTPGVVTLWYRAPEILLSSCAYDFSSDVWSLGCILAEMMLRKPIFQGNCVLTQLESITYALGTLNEHSFSEIDKLPDYGKVMLLQSPNHFDEIMSDCDKEGVSLLKKILVLDPKKRISLENIL